MRPPFNQGDYVTDKMHQLQWRVRNATENADAFSYECTRVDSVGRFQSVVFKANEIFETPPPPAPWVEAPATYDTDYPVFDED